MFFFFNDTATTEIYTLSLHDALPISETGAIFGGEHSAHYYFRDNFRADSGIIASLMVLEQLSKSVRPLSELRVPFEDRKSTRLNSSHGYISYAVFCLKKTTVISSYYS